MITLHVPVYSYVALTDSLDFTAISQQKPSEIPHSGCGLVVLSVPCL